MTKDRLCRMKDLSPYTSPGGAMRTVTMNVLFKRLQSNLSYLCSFQLVRLLYLSAVNEI